MLKPIFGYKKLLWYSKDSVSFCFPAAENALIDRLYDRYRIFFGKVTRTMNFRFEDVLCSYQSSLPFSYFMKKFPIPLMQPLFEGSVWLLKIYWFHIYFNGEQEQLFSVTSCCSQTGLNTSALSMFSRS